ncbi:MAG: hypothetical protein ACI4PM_05165 [Butyricicoccus sp.]
MKHKKLCFSKVGIVLSFLLYTELIVFGQAAMWHFGDLSSLDNLWLYALPPIIALLGYFLKATKENTCGGIVYETAMKESAADKKTDETEPERNDKPE